MNMDFSKLYIDGAWVESASGKMIDVENPATREIFARFAYQGAPAEEKFVMAPLPEMVSRPLPSRV